MGSTRTLGVRRKGTTEIGSRAKAMPCSLYAKAIRYCACEAGDSWINRPGCKGSAVNGSTDVEVPKGRDPIAETAANDWIPKMGKPLEGTKGDTSRA